MQVDMLQAKLAILLPTLPRQSLSTACVLAALERAMGKPPGRLARFQSEIERLWHAWAEAKPDQRRKRRKKKKGRGTAQEEKEDAHTVE